MVYDGRSAVSMCTATDVSHYIFQKTYVHIYFYKTERTHVLLDYHFCS